MADITSFKGYMYNRDKIDDLGLVMSPPYDALLSDEQDKLYSQHEYNAIRLSKGKRYDTDTESDNTFTRSRNYLEDWLKNDIIVQDEKPAIYLYEQEVEFNGYVYTNKGFVTLLKLEEFGNHVLTCEDTTPINKKDRYDLLYLLALGYPAQKSRTVKIEDNCIKYYEDENGTINVPKRELSEIIVKM